jgi:hypothetical protein
LRKVGGVGTLFRMEELPATSDADVLFRTLFDMKVLLAAIVFLLGGGDLGQEEVES